MAQDRVVYTVNWLDSVPDHTARSVARVREAGYEPYVHPTRGNLGEDDLIAILPGAVGVIAGSHRFSERVLKHAERLKTIARNGAGYDMIDLDYCTRHGIVVTNAVGANAPAVAEFALALILNLARGVSDADRLVRDEGWHERAKLRNDTIRDRTLGIVGFGAIGRQLANLVRGLQMRVVYTDVTPMPAAAEQAGAEFLPLDQLLRVSDFVSLHVALTAQTRHLINVERLALMKPTACLVNTSRGGVVDERALDDALRHGRLAGAALDVFETEPLRPDSDLLTLPQGFIGTPHMAGISTGAKAAMLDLATKNLLEVLAGGRPAGVTNPAVYAEPA